MSEFKTGIRSKNWIDSESKEKTFTSTSAQMTSLDTGLSISGHGPWVVDGLSTSETNKTANDVGRNGRYS